MLVVPGKRPRRQALAPQGSPTGGIPTTIRARVLHAETPARARDPRGVPARQCRGHAPAHCVARGPICRRVPLGGAVVARRLSCPRRPNSGLPRPSPRKKDSSCHRCRRSIGFLRARGLDQRRTPSRQDPRAFGFELTGDCWQCDVIYGPSLRTSDGKRRKAHLLAILDDAIAFDLGASFTDQRPSRTWPRCRRRARLVVRARAPAWGP